MFGEPLVVRRAEPDGPGCPAADRCGCSSSASTVMRPVTISQEVNDRALTTASSCCSAVARPSRRAPPILAWQRCAARVVDRPVLRPAARIAAGSVPTTDASSAASDRGAGHHGACIACASIASTARRYSPAEPIVGQMQVACGWIRSSGARPGPGSPPTPSPPHATG